MKKLLLITQGFPYGESEQMFLRTEFELLAKEFQVSVLSLNRGEPLLYPFDGLEYKSYFYEDPPFHSSKEKLLFFIKNNRFSHEVLQDIFLAIKHVSLKSALQRIKSILFYNAMANQIKKQIETIVSNDEINLIYTYWCTYATVASLQVKKQDKSLHVVSRFHGYDLYQERIPKSNWQCLRSFVYRNCDRLFFACNYGKQYFLEHWGSEYQDKCVVSYLGCNPIILNSEKSAHESLRIVSCSNLVQLKRVDLIIDALALMPNNIQVEWYHIGDGEELVGLLEKAKTELGHKNNITWDFKGYVPHNNIQEVYAQIQPDVFITTSETEGGAPVSIQESFSMGIPAIGTDVGGIPDLIHHGETGILLSADPTSEEVASAMIHFEEMSTQDKEAMAKNALHLWEQHFDAQQNAERMIAYLNDIL